MDSSDSSEDDEVIFAKTTFEWKIDNFKEKSRCQSQVFDIDGFLCHLVAYSCLGANEKFWLFCLDAPGLQYGSSLYPIYYTMCIVDLEGRDLIKHEGKVIGEIYEKTGILTTLRASYLEENKIMDTGSITLNFTFERRDEEVEKKQDLLLTECSSQTETSEPQPSKNICSNTGCSSHILECSSQTETSEPQPSKNICSNTEDKPASLLEKLSNDFSSFYESKTHTDCVLRVSEAQFPVHRTVLSARSIVFSAMFHHDTAENRSGLVDIPDVDATTLNNVLYYMYSGKIHGLTTETATFMYTVADKYALIELRKECLEFLRENLTIDNLCDAALLAHTHGEADLEEQVLYFIENRLEDILESNQWKEFSTIKPILASRLLGSAFISCKKKLVSEKTKIK